MVSTLNPLYALTAVLLLAMILGAGAFYTVYQKVGSLENAVAELNENYSRATEELQALRKSLEESQTSVNDLQSLVEQVESRIAKLESGLSQAATTEDLESLASELSALSELLDDMAQRISQLEKASEESGESIGSMLEQLSELQERLEALETRVEQVYQSIFFPAAIVDGTGGTVVIPEKPERIVSMAPSVTETLYYLGLLDSLVGVDSYSDFPPEVADLRESGEIADIGGFWTPSVEAILDLEPDLVIGVASAPPHIQVKETLEAYGIPVLLLPNNTLGDVRESIVMVGRATGNIVEAYIALAAFDRAVATARTLAGDTGVGVAVVVWLNPLFVVGGANWENDIIQEAGGVNVYSDVEGWPQVSYETLLEKNPDVIILMGGSGEEPSFTVEDFIQTLESQLGDAVWEIDAVKEGRIYVLLGDYNDAFARPSPRSALAVFVLAAILSPEAFGVQGELPQVISPSSFDIISLLEPRVSDEVLEFLLGALS